MFSLFILKSFIILFYIIAKSKNPFDFKGNLSVKTFRQKYKEITNGNTNPPQYSKIDR